MEEYSRQTIFSRAAKKLRADFEELANVPHKGLKGSEGERIVRAFLNAHLPKRFGVGAGFIIDPRNNVSKQTDVVVYDALNCPVYRASDEAAIFPSTNVAAVVEVKSSLDKERLKEAFENIMAVKRLDKYKAPPGSAMLSQTLGCVFAFDSAIKLDTIASHYKDLLIEHGIGHQIDLIVVLDQGVIGLASKMSNYPAWCPMFYEDMPEIEGVHLGIGVQELGPDSLDGFFRLLLAYLSHFQWRIDHPGFNWNEMSSQGMVKITYLISTTLERDPVLREAKLKEYEKEVKADFARYAVDSQRSNDAEISISGNREDIL